MKNFQTQEKKKSTIRKWTKHMNENFTEEDIHMANKHMIRCSTLSIREIQFKTTMRYHYTPIRLAKINHTDNTKC